MPPNLDHRPRALCKPTPSANDALHLNKETIRQSYEHAYTKYPFDPVRMVQFRAAEREAREHKRGLWGHPDP